MEATTTPNISSNRSSPHVVNHGEEERLKKAPKTVTVSRSSQDSEFLLSAELMDKSGELLCRLFMRTGMIESNETTIVSRSLSFDILRDSVQMIKSYLGVNVTSPTKKRRKQSIYFGHCTPKWAISSSGPLKKRIKQRYSLHSTSSLPLTPSGFYNFTPDFVCRNSDEPFANSDIEVTSLRMPLLQLSPNTTSEFQDCTDFATKKRKHEIDSFSMSLGSAHQLKLPPNNHKLRSAMVLPHFSRANLSTLVAPTPLVRPARARPAVLLPSQSPISLKVQSSGHTSVSFDEEDPNSYMCLIRQQFEFFELTPPDVALCKSKNVSVGLGQVALRCRHCTCISISFRPKGSLVVAKFHRSLYKHFKSGINSHIEELCPFVPKATKKMLEYLRLQNSFREQTPLLQDFGYWCALAKAEGVVETHGGLRFKSSLMVTNNDSLGAFQHDTKNLLYTRRQKTSTLCSGMSKNVLPPLTKDRIHLALHRNNQSLKDKRSNSIEKSFYSSQNHTTSKKPMAEYITNEMDTKWYDKRSHHEGAKPAARQQINVVETQQKQAAQHTWFRRLQDFIDYKDRNGHGQVPQQCPGNRALGIWVNKQRMNKKAKDACKASSMTDEKEKLLVDAGFIWAKPAGQAAWEDKFDELQKYFEKNGDCDVPSKYKKNRALGRWVSTQRTNYKKYKESGLTPYSSKYLNKKEMDRRIQLLNGINFSWTRFPCETLSEICCNGDDNNDLKQVISSALALDDITSIKQENDGSASTMELARCTRTIGDKKSPSPQLDLANDALDGPLSDLLGDVKLDETLGFSPLVDVRVESFIN